MSASATVRPSGVFSSVLIVSPRGAGLVVVGDVVSSADCPSCWQPVRRASATGAARAAAIAGLGTCLGFVMAVKYPDRLDSIDRVGAAVRLDRRLQFLEGRDPGSHQVGGFRRLALRRRSGAGEQGGDADAQLVAAVFDGVLFALLGKGPVDGFGLVRAVVDRESVVRERG